MRKPEGRSRLEDVGVDGRMILKLILGGIRGLGFCIRLTQDGESRRLRAPYNSGDSLNI
jgi:hypothetical protein